MFYSVNVKLTTSNTFIFIKNKFKRYKAKLLKYNSSFLLNHSHFFVNQHINSEETIQKTIRIFVKAATMKIFVFFEEMRKSRKPEGFQDLVARITFLIL